jgi:glycosyltransferase involved in cell wall biosynthesis
MNSELGTPNLALHVGLLTSDLSHRHGWAHYSLSLIEALRRVGVQLTVIATQDSPDVEGQTIHKLLPVRRNMLLRQMILLPQVRTILKDCNIIHAAIEPFAPLAAGIIGRRPLFITGHGSYVQTWAERRWPVNAIFRRAFLRSELVCISHYTAKVAREVLPEVKTVVINNGVNIERFQNLHTWKASDKSLLEKRRPTVLAVGAVKARKGTLELVQAMAEVRDEMPDVQCVIIGNLDLETVYVEQVRAAIQQLDLSGCVQLLGHVPESELIDWYATADVFALPSMNVGKKFEGYGLVYLEASAAGLPVIGTTDCGAEDAIDDGVTGLLITQAEVAQQLPKAILRILRDPALAARMGAAGREKALHQTWDHVAQQMIGVYRQALHVEFPR